VEMEKHFDGSLESRVNTQVSGEIEPWNTSGARNVHIRGVRPLEIVKRTPYST